MLIHLPGELTFIVGLSKLVHEHSAELLPPLHAFRVPDLYRLIVVLHTFTIERLLQLGLCGLIVLLLPNLRVFDSALSIRPADDQELNGVASHSDVQSSSA